MFLELTQLDAGSHQDLSKVVINFSHVVKFVSFDGSSTTIFLDNGISILVKEKFDSIKVMLNENIQR